jgi:OFA family oxalate/formate antiporter-like MFS transporter
LIDRPQKPVLVLIAAIILSFGLGSIHAFSVLLEPLESQLLASRAEIAFAYSLGLAMLTVAVLIGHRLYHLASPPALAGLTCVLAGIGLLVASLPLQHPAILWLGYGLIFGFANGIGYGFALYITNLAFDRHRGLAMGSVTAVYAIGASGFSKLLDYWTLSAGADGALLHLALALVLVGLIASFCLRLSRFKAETYIQASTSTDESQGLDRHLLIRCWLIYGAGVAAGLMAMGHAAGIVTSVSGTIADGVRGAIVITSANALGGFTAGYLADRLPINRLLAGSTLVSMLALLLLALVDSVWLAIGALAVIGFAYGSIISLFPIATASMFGRERYAIAYGRIFTSWGLAGLLAPWFAGFLYGEAGGYGMALLVAAALAAFSGVFSLTLPKGSSEP